MAGERDEGAQHRPEEAKAAARARMRTLRAAIPAAQRALAARAVAEAVLALPELADAQAVLVYAAFGDELPVDEVAERLLEGGRTVCFPRVSGAQIEAVPVSGLHELAPGWRGVREPAAERAPIAPAALDVVLVPGLAFDRRGHRLGYGGGHFDRFLAELSPAATAVGVAYDVQVVAELPDEAHDRPVDALVTESGASRTR